MHEHAARLLQEQHQEQSALLDGVLRRLPFPVVVTDRAGVVVLANPAADALTGWSADGTQALSGLRVHAAAERAVDLRSVAATAAESGTGAAGLEVRLGRPDGSVAHVMVETVPMAGESGHSHGAVIALLDITAQRLYEEHLHHAAYFDGLTGLPNRAMLWQHFTAVVRSAVPYAVLLIDLDTFKAVNDTYGHQAGDELLRGVARRLTDAVGSTATVARLGGDEFAVLLPGTSAESAEAAAVAVPAPGTVCSGSTRTRPRPRRRTVRCASTPRRPAPRAGGAPRGAGHRPYGAGMAARSGIAGPDTRGHRVRRAGDRGVPPGF